MLTKPTTLSVTIAALVFTALAVVANPVTARACSCASVDPIDAIGLADVVFTGTAVANEGTEGEPLWRFVVDGSVKGEVEPIEMVVGEDWGGGCGTDFSRYFDPIVVYAQRTGERLRALGCMPTPTAVDLASRLASNESPSGTGPPDAVLSGIVGPSDVMVLDAQGRALSAGQVGTGGGMVAHCPGTTLAAVVSSARPPTVTLVDLPTLTAVGERPIRSGWVSPAGDRVACLDGGRRVVSSAGYGPDGREVRVATSNATATGVADVVRSFADASRAVIHPIGTVFVLPWAVGDPLLVLSSENLETVDGGGVALPEGASVLDGDVSPDGSQLAMLVTLSGRPVEYDTGATHVVTVDLSEGVPVADGTSTVTLSTSGTSVESPEGAAKWIRWVDERSWAIEYETVSSKRIALVSTGGGQILPPIDVGWGWGLSPVGNGVLRTTDGGLEVVGADGTVTPGDPAPVEPPVDRNLSVATLVDAPPFSPETGAGTANLAITPVSAAQSAVEPGLGRPGAAPSGSGGSFPWPAVASIAAVALVGAGVALGWSHRR